MAWRIKSCLRASNKIKKGKQCTIYLVLLRAFLQKQRLGIVECWSSVKQWVQNPVGTTCCFLEHVALILGARKWTWEWIKQAVRLHRNWAEINKFDPDILVNNPPLQSQCSLLFHCTVWCWFVCHYIHPSMIIPQIYSWVKVDCGRFASNIRLGRKRSSDTSKGSR